MGCTQSVPQEDTASANVDKQLGKHADCSETPPAHKETPINRGVGERRIRIFRPHF